MLTVVRRIREFNLTLASLVSISSTDSLEEFHFASKISPINNYTDKHTALTKKKKKYYLHCSRTNSDETPDEKLSLAYIICVYTWMLIRTRTHNANIIRANDRARHAEYIMRIVCARFALFFRSLRAKFNIGRRACLFDISLL